MICIFALILALFSTTTYSITVSDEASIKSQLDTVLDLLHDEQVRLEAQEGEIEELKKIVAHQNPKTSSEYLKTGNPAPQNLYRRTCYEILLQDPSSTSGNYTIDPDGSGPGSPFEVYCNLTTGTTHVFHDSERPIQIDRCPNAGCYNRTINYSTTLAQIKTLTQLSASCHQFIKFNCLGVPFEFNGITYAWWNDRDGNPQNYWHGSDSGIHTCQCSYINNCYDPTLRCNCDSLAPEAIFDDGYLSEKSVLPITQVFFGRSSNPSSLGVHTVGQLECTGRAPLNGPPGSCEDLWLIGYTLGGIYTVKGDSNVRNVLCDFTKLPGDTGFETDLGEVDVKTQPVYFYARRNTTLNALGVIPFSEVSLNVGDSLNGNTGIFTAPVSGVYFFSFASQGNFTVSLEVNDVEIGRTTASMTPTLTLDDGDQIVLKLVSGSLIDTPGGKFTHYSGILLQES